MATARKKKASKRAASERAQRKRTGEIESAEVEEKVEPRKPSWFERLTDRMYASPVLVRLIAGVTDFVVGGSLTLLALAVPYYWLSGGQNLGTIDGYLAIGVSKSVVTLLVVIALVLSWCYYVLVPLRKWPGQTVGKRYMRLEVVKLNGDPAGIGTLTLRWLCTLIAETPAMAVTSYFMQLVGILTSNTVVSIWQTVGFGTTLISFGLLVASMNHRALHDYVAGTWVYRQDQ